MLPPAGPVGRNGQAATDWKMNAELLTYSRAKGLFAGIDLTGAVVDENVDATRTFYGVSYPSAENPRGQVATPMDARPFVRTVAKYFTESQKWELLLSHLVRALPGNLLSGSFLFKLTRQRNCCESECGNDWNLRWFGAW